MLEQLRAHLWASHAFLRAAERLTGCIEPLDDSSDIDTFAMMLSNAAVKLGGSKAGIDARRRMFAAVDRLAGCLPAHEGVIYRRLKVFKQWINHLEGDARNEARRKFLIEARQVMAMVVARKDNSNFIS